MKRESGPVPIHFARELVEELLVAASRRAEPTVAARFREEKDAIQGIETIDIREKRLDAFDGYWIDELGAAEPIESVLKCHGELARAVSKCVLQLARAEADQKSFVYADPKPLSGTDSTKPVLFVQLTVDTYLSRDKLEPLLTASLMR